jgi:hypothetical protein
MRLCRTVVYLVLLFPVTICKCSFQEAVHSYCEVSDNGRPTVTDCGRTSISQIAEAFVL